MGEQVGCGPMRTHNGSEKGSVRYFPALQDTEGDVKFGRLPVMA